MTSLTEYNTGKKATIKGSDRLEDLVLPVLVEGVNSMIQSPYYYEVDVYLVLGYRLREDRYRLIRQRLPASVGLDVWDDATPLTYDADRRSEGVNYMENLTRSLARQHRCVVKDKLFEYDFFLAFEDDMLVKGEHIQQYINMTNELQRLEAEAPRTVAEHKRVSAFKLSNMFYGPLNKRQLSRMIPGFLRVEMLSNQYHIGTQEELDPIPVDLQFPVSTGDGKTEMVEKHVDPRPCCHAISEKVPLPNTLSSDNLFLWETGIRALGVREMPEFSNMSSWVVLLRGNRYRHMSREEVIGDYWSGRDGDFGKDFYRPFEGEPNYLSNQGGWMATRQQIWDWHTIHCNGGFLPPFDEPTFKQDGLLTQNVEFWSGGMQLSQTPNCNLQRIVSLDPEVFSRQLIYHAANNKQLELYTKKQRFVRINHLFGQLNSVRKNAVKAKAKDQATSIFSFLW